MRSTTPGEPPPAGNGPPRTEPASRSAPTASGSCSAAAGHPTQRCKPWKSSCPCPAPAPTSCPANAEDAVMLDHQKVLDALKAAFPGPRGISLVAQHADARLGLPKRRVHVFIPDCHMLAPEDQAAYPRTGFFQ